MTDTQRTEIGEKASDAAGLLARLLHQLGDSRAVDVDNLYEDLFKEYIDA